MRITLRKLRNIVREAKVGASPEYLKKERVREQLQQVIASMVSSGDIKDEKDLQDLFGAADMSLKALKMIPFEVWQKMSRG